MAEELSLCRGQATTASGREDCLAPESFRETVGNARGKGSQEVKDSEVREFLEEGALDEVWSLLESCPEGSDAACATTAKGMLADALGKDSLTDDEPLGDRCEADDFQHFIKISMDFNEFQSISMGSPEVREAAA